MDGFVIDKLMINGDWDFGWSEDEIQTQGAGQLKWMLVCGKLSRESKFIFNTTWEAVSRRGSEIRRKSMVVKVICIL